MWREGSLDRVSTNDIASCEDDEYGSGVEGPLTKLTQMKLLAVNMIDMGVEGGSSDKVSSNGISSCEEDKYGCGGKGPQTK